MIIISWDVGIIHLAYCILKYQYDELKGQPNIEILDWDEINLIEDDRIKITCCGVLKSKKNEPLKECGKNATYLLNVDDKKYGFCKTHLKQHANYWTVDNTKKLFKEKITKHQCDYTKKNGSKCGKKTKYIYTNKDESEYYCTTHYKSVLHKKLKDYAPQLIKNLIVKEYPTSQLQLNLINRLDKLSEHFAKLGIEEVVIENQPAKKHPKMKSIANTLFDYFLIRGYIDKKQLNVNLVRFICPSNKLKVDQNNTLKVFKANKDDKKKYKLTKALGIQYTTRLLKNDNLQLEYLDLYEKQDDICDAYLQGRYYLQFIRNKKDMNVKTNGKSKSAKKILKSRKTKVHQTKVIRL